MKYNDTYSMIGAMLNQGFETEFKKERKKKEKRRRFFQKLNADKHSPASSAWSTKRWVRGMLMSVGVESSH